MMLWSELRHQARYLGRGAAAILRCQLVSPARPVGALRTAWMTRRQGPLVAMLTDVRDPEATAIVDRRRQVTYAELRALSQGFALALDAEGVTQSDTVAVLCRNHVEFAVSAIGTAIHGARLVLLNTGSGEAELAALAAEERFSAVVRDADLGSVLDDMGVATFLAGVDAGKSSVLDAAVARHGVPCRSPKSPGELVLLSSGTTGAPRGTPRRRVSSLAAAQVLDRIPLKRGGAIAIAPPLFHGTALQKFVLAVAMGKTVLLDDSPTFDPRPLARAVIDHGADSVVLVPTMLRRLLEAHDDCDLGALATALRIVVVGGSHLDARLATTALDVLGPIIYNVYGTTETGIVSVATPEELRSVPGSVGRAPAGCAFEVRDSEGRAATEGQIFARTPMRGGNKLGRRGFTATGDVGCLREGVLVVRGRVDDMIVSGAENVYPDEVEAVLRAHPAIEDAIVSAVTDHDFGERLQAHVVRAPGDHPVTAEELRAHVRVQLARHKVPRDIVFCSTLPRNALGKLVRMNLAEQAVVASSSKSNQARGPHRRQEPWRKNS